MAATIAFPGIAGYSATKSAVDRMTRVAAMESGKLGYGVRVNCIYPGLVPTEMGVKLAVDLTGFGLFDERRRRGRRGGRADAARPRWARSSDMADAVVFLASDAAAGSSPAPACRSTAEWGCDHDRAEPANPSSSTAPPATPAG